MISLLVDKQWSEILASVKWLNFTVTFFFIIVDKFDANSMLLSKPWWILGLELSHLHLFVTFFVEFNCRKGLEQTQKFILTCNIRIFLLLFVKENMLFIE